MRGRGNPPDSKELKEGEGHFWSPTAFWTKQLTSSSSPTDQARSALSNIGPRSSMAAIQSGQHQWRRSAKTYKELIVIPFCWANALRAKRVEVTKLVRTFMVGGMSGFRKECRRLREQWWDVQCNCQTKFPSDPSVTYHPTARHGNHVRNYTLRFIHLVQ